MHTKEMVQKVMLSIFIKQQPLKSTPGEIFLFWENYNPNRPEITS